MPPLLFEPCPKDKPVARWILHHAALQGNESSVQDLLDAEAYNQAYEVEGHLQQAPTFKSIDILLYIRILIKRWVSMGTYKKLIFELEGSKNAILRLMKRSRKLNYVLEFSGIKMVLGFFRISIRRWSHRGLDRGLDFGHLMINKLDNWIDGELDCGVRSNREFVDWLFGPRSYYQCGFYGISDDTSGPFLDLVSDHLLRHHKGKQRWKQKCRLPTKPFPERPSQGWHRKSMRRVVEPPGFINNHQISALPDTGAARNMMSAAYARKHKIPIHQGSEYCRSFKLANGRTIRSRGIARATWSFNDSQGKTYDLEFHILADCPCDVLVGARFLQETETLSLHRHRLRKRNVSPRDIRFVNLCGSPSQFLLGLLNGESISALPDTGSEVNLISEKYARDHGLIIYTDDDSRGLLQFADGTTQEALGRVTAKWAFKDDIDNPMNVSFEVLAECAYDVILGQEILYQHEAYSKHRTCLVDVELEPEPGPESEPGPENQDNLRLNLVGWLPRCLRRIKRKQDQGMYLKNITL